MDIIAFFNFLETQGVNGGVALILVCLFGGYLWLLKPDIKKIKTTVTDLHNATRENQQTVFPKKKPLHFLEKLTWSHANSPLQLNKRGKTLLEKSGMDRIVESNMPRLIKLLLETKPQTSYDVQENAFHVLSGFVSDEEKISKQVKTFIYNTPQIDEKEIGIPDLVYVGSLVLRDQYLKEHSEIKE